MILFRYRDENSQRDFEFMKKQLCNLHVWDSLMKRCLQLYRPMPVEGIGTVLLQEEQPVALASV